MSDAYRWQVVDDSLHTTLRAEPIGPIDRMGWRRYLRAAVVPMARPSLCAILVERLEALLEASERGTSTTARARTAIAAQLRAERGSVDELARSLGLSRRSLERALAAEQTSPAALFDEERRTRALAWLPALPISVIAARLGYSDGRAFARAFRRWTGASPREYAAQQTFCDNNGTVTAPR